MYLRFVVAKTDEGSGRRQGIFQALWDLEERGLFLAHERTTHKEISNWFGKHLREPRSLSRSSKPHAKNVAISWFKDNVHEHIAKMFALSHILEEHGIAVEVIRTDRPGYIVYEDRYQVAAEPFSDTVT
jgi:hypothetical protein